MSYIYCISLLTLLIFLLFLKQKPSREVVFYLTDSLEGIYYYYIIIIIFCSLYLVYSLLDIEVFSKYLVYVHNTTSPKSFVHHIGTYFAPYQTTSPCNRFKSVPSQSHNQSLSGWLKIPSIIQVIPFRGF